jgi:hypothetical protein
VIVTERRTVLLDTNVWSRLADYDHGASLDRSKRAFDVDFLVSPLSLVEASSNPDPLSRRSILRLMSDTRWRRGRRPPEIADMAGELLAVIALHRPDWVRPEPRSDETAYWLRFWTSTIYEDAALRPDAIARGTAAAKRLSDPATSVHANQLANRDSLRSSGLLPHFPEISFILDPNTKDAPSWFGGRTDVPMWSHQAADTWLNGLTERVRAPRRNTFRDWLEPFVDLNALFGDFGSFYEMWWSVEPSQAPRHWMSWAVGFLQLGYKLNPSNAVDQLIATYLYDADLFLTLDARFAEVLDEVSPFSPRPLAVVRRPSSDRAQFWPSFEAALAT